MSFDVAPCKVHYYTLTVHVGVATPSGRVPLGLFWACSTVLILTHPSQPTPQPVITPPPANPLSCRLMSLVASSIEAPGADTGRPGTCCTTVHYKHSRLPHPHPSPAECVVCFCTLGGPSDWMGFTIRRPPLPPLQSTAPCMNCAYVHLSPPIKGRNPHRHVRSGPGRHPASIVLRWVGTWVQQRLCSFVNQIDN